MPTSASPSAQVAPPEPDRVARSNAEDAYQAIRRLIVNVELSPGMAFTEQELVRRIGVGKTPVREALLRLKLERMVAVQARAGYRVAPVTLKDIRDACRLMGYLEADAARAVSGSDIALDQLAPLDDDVTRAASEPRAGAWVRADWLFHLGLARHHENQRQVEVMSNLGLAMLRFGNLAGAMKVPGELLHHSHAELLGAARDGDADVAADAASTIWQATERTLVTALSATEAILSTNVWGPDDRNAFYLDAVSLEAVDENPFDPIPPKSASSVTQGKPPKADGK